MDAASESRWNTTDFAAGYDEAAERVHPHYVAIQDVLLRQLAPPARREWLVVDLGGGSGRLLERVLDRWPYARAILIDQSEPFLVLAERRLARFGARVQLIKACLQDNWPAALAGPVDRLVSMSAIHHLDPDEKQTLFARCFLQLAPAGAFLNGDEVRAETDAAYLQSLQDWAGHMRSLMAARQVAPAFHAAIEGWIERNVARFGQPKLSGDDCHQTIGQQLEYLAAAGFKSPECVWQRGLWAVFVARK